MLLSKGPGDLGSIPGSGRSPGEGNGNPLRSSCLENSMDRGAWWAARSQISQTRLSHYQFLFYPNLWDLMLNDLRWSWCNNSRNKVPNKCNALESSWNHPPLPPGLWKKNCLSQNWSLVPRRLGSAALGHLVNFEKNKYKTAMIELNDLQGTQTIRRGCLVYQVWTSLNKSFLLLINNQTQDC